MTPTNHGSLPAIDLVECLGGGIYINSSLFRREETVKLSKIHRGLSLINLSSCLVEQGYIPTSMVWRTVICFSSEKAWLDQMRCVHRNGLPKVYINIDMNIIRVYNHMALLVELHKYTNTHIYIYYTNSINPYRFQTYTLPDYIRNDYTRNLTDDFPLNPLNSLDHRDPDPGWLLKMSVTRWSNPPYMDVSKNRGTPKWMVYNGNPYEN